MLTIYIPGPPETATAQQKGVRIVRGRPMFFTKSRVIQAEQRILAAIKPPASTFPDGPLSVGITFVFPLRTRDVERCDLIAMSTRPDIDNLTKGYVDAFTRAGYWTDDSQIAALAVSKWRGPHPGTLVTIERLDPSKTEAKQEALHA